MSRAPTSFALAAALAAAIALAAAGGAAAQGAGPTTIRVGSFNIANFGDTDEYERSLLSLVNVLRELDADVVALQEIEPTQLGWDQVARLTEMLNIAAEYDGTAAYSAQVAGDDARSGDETTAFLWRAPVRMISAGISLMPHAVDPDNGGLPTFQRVPSMATFRAGNLDFILVDCHLYTRVDGKTSEGRTAECAAISDWLVSLPAAAEKDAVVVGDFNRFLNGKAPWARLMAPGYEAFYRFPLLEAIHAQAPRFDPRTDEAPDDRFSTTTSKKQSIYDQVIVSAGAFADLAAEPVFGEDTGLVAFDNDPHYEWFIGDWNRASVWMSDHRPVWVRLRTDLPDDD
jgi:endonuclease/exonuclease/phosphatase family metal-dependent hydrolase